MGSLGKKLSRGSLHLLGSNLAVEPGGAGGGGGERGEAEAAEGLLLSGWLQPAQHKSTTSDWAAKVVPITGAGFDGKEPSKSMIREQRGARTLHGHPSSLDQPLLTQGPSCSHPGLGSKEGLFSFLDSKQRGGEKNLEISDSKTCK